MTLTTAQLDQLVENYAERIVDDMDTKCLMQFVYDTIVENLAGKSEEDVLEEISWTYDEDVIQELVEGVTVE
jgi:tRNA U54 and U55 pseudouridine synthase Pus10